MFGTVDAPEHPWADALHTAMARIIVSMAYCRLGWDKKTRAELKAGRETVESRFSQKTGVGGPVWGFGFGSKFLRALLW